MALLVPQAMLVGVDDAFPQPPAELVAPEGAWLTIVEGRIEGRITTAVQGQAAATIRYSLLRGRTNIC